MRIVGKSTISSWGSFWALRATLISNKVASEGVPMDVGRVGWHDDHDHDHDDHEKSAIGQHTQCGRGFGKGGRDFGKGGKDFGKGGKEKGNGVRTPAREVRTAAKGTRAFVSIAFRSATSLGVSQPWAGGSRG